MELMQNAIAIVGVFSIMGLWGVCLAAGLVALWETFGPDIMVIVESLKRW